MVVFVLPVLCPSPKPEALFSSEMSLAFNGLFNGLSSMCTLRAEAGTWGSLEMASETFYLGVHYKRAKSLHNFRYMALKDTYTSERF